VCRVFDGFDDPDPPEQPQGADEGTHYTLTECPDWHLRWPKTQILLGTRSPRQTPSPPVPRTNVPPQGPSPLGMCRTEGPKDAVHTKKDEAVKRDEATEYSEHVDDDISMYLNDVYDGGMTAAATNPNVTKSLFNAPPADDAQKNDQCQNPSKVKVSLNNLKGEVRDALPKNKRRPWGKKLDYAPNDGASQKPVLGSWAACLVCARFSVHVVVSTSRSCALASFWLGLQLLGVDHHCSFFVFFSFFIRLGIGSVWYDFSLCRHDTMSACVGVGCVHPSRAEVGCVLIVFLSPKCYIMSQ
jgi:hypothetical protein